MRNYIFYILLAVVGYSCGSGAKKPSTIDLPFIFSEEINRLVKSNPSVTKMSKGESISKSNLNWDNELKLFVDFENQYWRTKESYSKQEINEGEVKSILFTCNKNESPFTSAEYKFKGNKCVQIKLTYQYDKVLFSSGKTLIYNPGIGYEIIGAQKLKPINELEYELKVLFQPKEVWQGKLDLGTNTLPFNFSIKDSSFSIYNANEVIVINDIIEKDDSLFIEFPVFQSRLIVAKSENKLEGVWDYYAKGDYKIPFTGYKGVPSRFTNNSVSNKDVSGKWKVSFSPNTSESYPAIGVFEQINDKVTGTFITETGDYRYLEGNIKNDSLFLSCFDGSHAFLFNAKIDENGTLTGNFYSGKHWQEPWIAERNDSFKLKNPYELTQLVSSDSSFNFSFKNLEGKSVSLTDSKYDNKVVVVQVMGSWCPNCIDETKMLNQLYSKYNSNGLEVIALCFERSADFEQAKKAVMKVKNHLNVPYEMLIAGRASKKTAAEALPMLNHIMSYPTTIYLNRQKKVERIHTGFYGPGTGPYYEEFLNENNAFVESLLQ